MKALTILLPIIIILLFSFCKNDDDIIMIPEVSDPEPEIQLAENYSLLNPGNYWIYQEIDENLEGEFIRKNQFDSTFVEKDTMIGDVNFAKIYITNIGVSEYYYLRNEKEKIIDPDGNVFFSTGNFGELLKSTDEFVGTYNEYMVGPREITTDLGTFLALKKEYDLDASPIISLNDCGLISQEYWVEGIGMVLKERYWAGTCTRMRRELIRYKVN